MRRVTRQGSTENAAFAPFLDLFSDPDPEFAWMVEEARGFCSDG